MSIPTLQQFNQPGLPDQILRAVTVAAAITVVALMVFVPLSTNDFWLQVKIGGMIWNDHKIPETVLFTFTEVKDFPFHAHEWLPSVIFYLLHQHFGYENLLIVKGALGLLIFWLCYRLAYRWTSDFSTSLFLAMVTMTMINYRFVFRPELFACLFFIIFLNLLTEYKLTRRMKYMVWILPLAVIWANSHGTFPIMIVITGILALGEGIDVVRNTSSVSWRSQLAPVLEATSPYLVCCAAILVATLANPYGYKLYVFAWDFAQWTATKLFIFEWLPTFSDWFMETRGFWVYVYGLLLCLALIATFYRELPTADALLLIAFGYLAADRCRHIVLFSFVLLYVAAKLIRSSGIGQSRRLTTGLLLTLMLIWAGALLRFGNMYEAYPYFTRSDNFTPELINYVNRSNIKGNTLTSYTLGAELIQKFYPRLRPSIDSRIDAYGEQYFYVHTWLFSDENLLSKFVGEYDVRYMLLVWKEFNLIKNMPMLKKSGWRMLFGDHKMVLLERGAWSVETNSNERIADEKN